MEVLDESGNVIHQNNEESKRIIAGILGILLGSLGVHKFVLGYTTQGIIMLAITIVTCGRTWVKRVNRTPGFFKLNQHSRRPI